MDGPRSLFGLLMLRQFLAASGRLWAIMARSRPWAGFPILRAFLDLLERMAHDPAPENVAPALGHLLAAIEGRCPGVTDAVLRDGAGHDRGARPGGGPAVETPPGR